MLELLVDKKKSAKYTGRCIKRRYKKFSKKYLSSAANVITGADKVLLTNILRIFLFYSISVGPFIIVVACVSNFVILPQQHGQLICPIQKVYYKR